MPAAAAPTTQHPLLTRPLSAGGAATAASSSLAAATAVGGTGRYEAIYRAALAQARPRSAAQPCNPTLFGPLATYLPSDWLCWLAAAYQPVPQPTSLCCLLARSLPSLRS